MGWLAIPAVLLLIILVVLIRTFMFKPLPQKKVEAAETDFDETVALANLRELIRCKTVSNYDHAKEDDAEFEKLIGLLPKLYPAVFEKCEFKRFEDRGLLFHWAGKDASEPAVLMAHYDVVPVNEDLWEKPPFEAIVEDGILWGRGSLDTKISFNSALTAANYWISKGFVPEHDIYMAFSGGEEVNGNGAKHIVAYFREKGITPGLVLDEGGAVVEGIFPGVKGPCAVVGIAEKGMLNVHYKVRSNGGHASAPKPGGPVDVLAEACTRVVSHPFKAHYTKPVKEMFETLGRKSSFVYRMIFSNMWLFFPVIDGICKKGGGDLNAMMRTTVAFTQMRGSSACNVIPPEAEIVSNIRLNPDDTVDGAYAYLKKVVNNDQIEITIDDGAMDPSPVSRTDVAGWDKIKDAIAATWPEATATAYLMVQCSDSRHYAPISDRVYRFSAMDITAEERATIHGNNERVHVQTVYNAAKFYINLIKSC